MTRAAVILLASLIPPACGTDTGRAGPELQPEEPVATQPSRAAPSLAEMHAQAVADAIGINDRWLPLADLYPKANAQTRQFLEWAHEKHPLFCTIDLNEAGECTAVFVHPCYPVKDDELAVISGLKEVESLTFYARWITDAGLLHLETMPRLKELTLCSVGDEVTEAALARLEQLNPRLNMVAWRDSAL